MKYVLICSALIAGIFVLTVVGLNAYTNGVLFACFTHCLENGQMPTVTMYQMMAEICASGQPVT